MIQLLSQDSVLGGGGVPNFTMDVATIAPGNTITQNVNNPFDTASGTTCEGLFQDMIDYIDYLYMVMVLM